MKEFIEKLKVHLRAKRSVYVEHNSWNGDTEMGFYETDNFDIEKMMTEIDEFSASFQMKKDNDGKS